MPHGAAFCKWPGSRGAYDRELASIQRRIRPPPSQVNCRLRLSVQAGTLEEAIAIARGDAHLEGAAVPVDHQWHFHPGLAQRPYLAKKAGEVAHLGAGNGKYDVAAAQIGPARRPALGYPCDHHLVVDLGGVEPQPRPRRSVGTAQSQKVAEDRLENIDGYDHVERLGLTFAPRLLHL